jgi:hypothetical protein
VVVFLVTAVATPDVRGLLDDFLQTRSVGQSAADRQASRAGFVVLSLINHDPMAWGTGGSPTALVPLLVRSLMRSAPRRALLLDPATRDVGIRLAPRAPVAGVTTAMLNLTDVLGRVADANRKSRECQVVRGA